MHRNQITPAADCVNSAAVLLAYCLADIGEFPAVTQLRDKTNKLGADNIKPETTFQVKRMRNFGWLGYCKKYASKRINVNTA